MTLKITTLVIIAVSSFVTASQYRYPEPITVDLSCKMDVNEQQKIEAMYSEQDAGIAGLAKAYPVDLNDDDICEVYLDNPSIYEGNGNAFTSVLIKINNSYINAGDIQGEPDQWWYGSVRNGFYRILVPSYIGSRSNPTLVTHVFYIDDNKVSTEFNSKYSHGMFMDLGLSSYRKKQYAIAETYYLNAYRMQKEKTLRDANNLAITWIKLGKFKDAKILLQKELMKPHKPSHKSAAYFNLGIIEEYTLNYSESLDLYTKSYKLKPTEAKSRKINTVKQKIDGGK